LTGCLATLGSAGADAGAPKPPFSIATVCLSPGEAPAVADRARIVIDAVTIVADGVPDAIIELRGPGAVVRAKTDSCGRAVVEPLEQGTYEVRFDAPGSGASSFHRSA
jgi:hypothetical protein